MTGRAHGSTAATAATEGTGTVGAVTVGAVTEGAVLLGAALLGAVLLGTVFLGAEPASAEPLGERDIVARVLGASPALRAATHDVQAAGEGVRAESARYTPTVYVGIDGGHTERLGGSLEGVTASGSDGLGVEGGVRLGSAWGTELDIGVSGSLEHSEVTRDPSSARLLDLDTLYAGDAHVTLTQPVLRGAGRDVGEADLRAARHARAAAIHERDTTRSDQLRTALSAYWRLWSAQRAVAVERAALALAERQRDEEVERVRRLGTAAEADVLRFEAEVASLAASLAGAEAAQESRAIALGAALALPPSESLTLVVSGGAPLVDPGSLDGATVEATLDASTELAAMAADIERSREKLGVLEDDELPELDVTASLTLGGLWDDRTLPSLGLPSDRPAVTALVGVRLELPVHGDREAALLAQARHAVAAAEARLEARRQALASEAATRRSALDAAVRRERLAQRSEEVSGRLAEAEAGRLSIGLSTPLQVVEAREQQRVASLARLEADVDARVAALELAHVSGSLLRRCAPSQAGDADSDTDSGTDGER